MHDISLEEYDDCMRTQKESGADHRKLNFLHVYREELYSTWTCHVAS